MCYSCYSFQWVFMTQILSYETNSELQRCQPTNQPDLALAFSSRYKLPHFRVKLCFLVCFHFERCSDLLFCVFCGQSADRHLLLMLILCSSALTCHPGSAVFTCNKSDCGAEWIFELLHTVFFSLCWMCQKTPVRRVFLFSRLC